jgi:hypothetical protein
MTKGETVDLRAVTESGRESGIEHGEALIAFAEAIVGRDPAEVARARQRLADEMGVAAMVDAAAVASNFERMVRIADGTGIPLGEQLEARARPVIDELQLDRLKGGGAAS